MVTFVKQTIIEYSELTKTGNTLAWVPKLWHSNEWMTTWEWSELAIYKYISGDKLTLSHWTNGRMNRWTYTSHIGRTDDGHIYSYVFAIHNVSRLRIRKKFFLREETFNNSYSFEWQDWKCTRGQLEIKNYIFLKLWNTHAHAWGQSSVTVWELKLGTTTSNKGRYTTLAHELLSQWLLCITAQNQSLATPCSLSADVYVAPCANISNTDQCFDYKLCPTRTIQRWGVSY